MKLKNIAALSVATAALLIVAAACSRSSTESVPAGDSAVAATAYTCPMHPQIKSDKPGSCSICGMTLVPVAATNAPSAKP
jgi:hypothetical protein